MKNMKKDCGAGVELVNIVMAGSGVDHHVYGMCYSTVGIASVSAVLG